MKSIGVASGWNNSFVEAIYAGETIFSRIISFVDGSILPTSSASSQWRWSNTWQLRPWFGCCSWSAISGRLNWSSVRWQRRKTRSICLFWPAVKQVESSNDDDDDVTFGAPVLHPNPTATRFTAHGNLNRAVALAEVALGPIRTHWWWNSLGQQPKVRPLCAIFFSPLIYRTTLTISVKVTCWRQLYCVDHKLILVFDWIDNFVWNLNLNLNWRAKPQNWSMDVRYCDGMFGSFFINATRFVYFFIHFFFFFFFFFMIKRQFILFFFVVFNRMGLCSDRKDGTGRHFSNWSRPSASVGRSTHHTAVRMAGNVRRFFGVTFC